MTQFLEDRTIKSSFFLHIFFASRGMMYFRSHLLASYFMIKEAARGWGVREGEGGVGVVCYFIMGRSYAAY